MDAFGRIGPLQLNVQRNTVGHQPEHILQHGNLVPSFKGQLLDFKQGVVFNVSAAVRKAVDGFIVEYHDLAAFGFKHVDLDHVDSQVERLLHRGQGILSLIPHRPPVADDQWLAAEIATGTHTANKNNSRKNSHGIVNLSA